MSRLVASIAVAAVILCVCPPTGLAQPEAIPADFLIKLERTACFGSCPVYSVTIDAQGTVIYEGTSSVSVEGRQTDRIPASAVNALLATAERIGFYDLRDSYRAPITDLPTTFVTMTANGRTKRIEDHFSAPPGLKELERQIDEAARTARWVRGAPRAHNPIEWSPNRKLTVEDFRADVPRRSQQANVQRGALSFMRIEAGYVCRDERADGSVRAIFLPGESWWAGAQSQMWERVRDSKSWLSASRHDLEMKTAINEANKELLKHEQLHFDMAELAARKIRRVFEEDKAACPTGGDDALNRFVGEVTRDFRQEQARYDEETKHGTFLFNQGKWESRVKAALSK